MKKIKNINPFSQFSIESYAVGHMKDRVDHFRVRFASPSEKFMKIDQHRTRKFEFSRSQETQIFKKVFNSRYLAIIIQSECSF